LNEQDGQAEMLPAVAGPPAPAGRGWILDVSLRFIVMPSELVPKSVCLHSVCSPRSEEKRVK